MTKISNGEEITEKHYFTQKELAGRWHVSAGTLINLRNNGAIPFFKVPGSSKILYPVEQIIECEHQHTTANKEVEGKQQQRTESKRKTPVVSTKPEKEWRI